jgi:hypothetical protein
MDTSTWITLASLIIGAWAVLTILGGERLRQQQEKESAESAKATAK